MSLYGVPPASGSRISAVQAPGFPVWDWRCQLPRQIPGAPVREQSCSLLGFHTPESRGLHTPLPAMGFSAVRGARLSRMGLAVPALRKFPVPRPGTGLLASLLPHTREPGHIPSAPTAGSWLFCCVGTRFSRMELALPAPRQISGAPVSRGRTVPHI